MIREGEQLDRKEPDEVVGMGCWTGRHFSGDVLVVGCLSSIKA